jgi:formylglycine-generating enzyme required for sulfatase activity
MLGLGLLIALVVAITEAYSVHSRTQELLVSLPATKVENLRRVLERLSVYPRWVYSGRLRDLAERGGDDPRSQFGYSLALLPEDPGQVEYLYERLLEANPAEMTLLRDSLAANHRGELMGRLWADLRGAALGDARVLPLAAVLSAYAPDDARWPDLGDKVARAMVKAKLEDVASWREALRGLRTRLIGPLVRIFRDTSPDHLDHELATRFLAEYGADDPASLVDVLLDADPKAFGELFPVIQRDPTVMLAALRNELESPPTPPAGVGSSESTRTSKKEAHQEHESDAAAARRSARRARAAVALVRLGSKHEVWAWLEHRKEPEVRSYLVTSLASYGTDPSVLAGELERQGEGEAAFAEKNAYLLDASVSRRRALLNSLVGYPKDRLDPEVSSRLLSMVIELYRRDPDAGVHSSAELVLRRWGYLDRVELEPGRPPRPGEPIRRRWYVNSEGQTMVLIDGPVEFDMGSPDSEPRRGDFEPFHLCRIPRRFAIASKEVSIRSYQKFSMEVFKYEGRYVEESSPTPDCPMPNRIWFEAAAYCNWLSDKEGLRKCYVPIKDGESAKGMRIDPEAVAAGGYRLPTEAEWEYACRAGTVSSRYFGSSPALLLHYEWYLENSRVAGVYQTHPCGSLLPNDLGLFDILGNVVEWCQDRHRQPQTHRTSFVVDEIRAETVGPEDRVLRGSSFRRQSLGLRSANHAWDPAGAFEGDYGLRVARTVP